MNNYYIAGVTAKELAAMKEAAWELYCEESKGAMSAVDFWEQLGPNTQSDYLMRVMSSGLRRSARIS